MCNGERKIAPCPPPPVGGVANPTLTRRNGSRAIANDPPEIARNSPKIRANLTFPKLMILSANRSPRPLANVVFKSDKPNIFFRGPKAAFAL